MIASADTVPANTRLRCDICIVGVGAACLPLALTVEDCGLDVPVLEFGEGPELSQTTQALYAGKVDETALHTALDICCHRRSIRPGVQAALEQLFLGWKPYQRLLNDSAELYLSAAGSPASEGDPIVTHHVPFLGKDRV